MAITTTCSGCGKTLAVADEFAGRQARCPECGQIYTVPSPGSPSAQPNAAAKDAKWPLDSTSPKQTSGPYDAGLGTGAPLDLSNPLGPTGSFPENRPAPAQPQAAASSAMQYWMKATNGAEYGPADKATLGRWFNEGRVGNGYQIREGEYGSWQPATNFRPTVAPGFEIPASTNPFATQSTAGASASGRGYVKTDQSGLVLAMGILAWIGACPIFGIIAWVVGAQALKDMQQGTADPTTRGLVQVGYYLGMINVVLWIGCAGLSFVFMAISVIATVGM